MAIEAGRVLSERYRLIRPVGQGSQASVWVAEHLALTTHVAVKLISQELAKKDTARERFRREAEKYDRHEDCDPEVAALFEAV